MEAASLIFQEKNPKKPSGLPFGNEIEAAVFISHANNKKNNELIQFTLKAMLLYRNQM